LRSPELLSQRKCSRLRPHVAAGTRPGKTIRYVSSSFLLAEELVTLGRDAGVMPYRAPDRRLLLRGETSLWLYSLA